MSHTLYASFANPDDAERAAGALIDQGVRAEDLSVVRQHTEGTTETTSPTTVATNVRTELTNTDAVPATTGSVYGVPPDAGALTSAPSSLRAEGRAEIAPTTTQTATPLDASSGARKGTMIGAGLGVVAAIAALAIPGVGFVLGAGALASALGGIAATAGAGAAAGAIVGYLKEQGVDEEIASEYGDAVEGGGAVLAVTVPSGTVDEATANAILNEHSAANVNRYAARGFSA